MAAFTGLPGFIRLSSSGAAACLEADTHLETGLLRHRPDSVLPLSWLADKDGKTVLYAETRGLAPLCESIQAMEKEKITGYRLLERIMEAVDEALDHLLLIEEELLRPDLIFTAAGCTESETAIKLICLPFTFSLSGTKEGHEPLIDLLARVFQWEALTANRFKRLFANQAYAELLEEARALAGHPRQETGTKSPGPHKRPPPSHERRGLSSLIQSLARTIFWPAGRDTVHEKTRELDLAPGNYKIAQLSEGLPGTPEEEGGRRAYILTEEFLIGRDMGGADLCIDSSAVSRLHARILLKGGSFFVEDLGSSNGTTLDGVRLNRHREYLLPDKCRIAFAGHFFYFRCE